MLFWIALQSRTVEVYAYKDNVFQGQHSGILNKIYYLQNNMYDVLDNYTYFFSDNVHSVNQISVLHASKIVRSNGSYIIFLPTKS